MTESKNTKHNIQKILLTRYVGQYDYPVTDVACENVCYCNIASSGKYQNSEFKV
jgi:hypothetical protein